MLRGSDFLKNCSHLWAGKTDAPTQVNIDARHFRPPRHPRCAHTTTTHSPTVAMSDDDPQAMNRLRAIVAAESTRRASEGTARRLPYVSFQPWSAPQEGASAMVDAASWASRAVAVNVGDMAPDVLLASYEKIATDGVIAIKSVGNEDVTARVTELVVKPIREIQSKIKEAMKQGESCAAAASALAPLAEVVALIVSTTKEPSVKETSAAFCFFL